LAYPGPEAHAPIQAAIESDGYKRFALVVAFLVWTIFVFSALRQDHLLWHHYLVGGRIVMAAGALLALVLATRTQSRNVVATYFVICMALQASFACLESDTKTDFYKYVPTIFLIHSLTFTGHLKAWLRSYAVPVSMSLLVPLGFKSQSLFMTLGHFAFAFTESIAITAAAIVFLKVSSDKFRALSRSLELQTELASVKSVEAESYARRLEEAKIEIERAEHDRAVANVVGLVSHDVRRPLSLFKTALSQLRSIKEPNKIKEYTAQALPEVQRALDSVEGLLQDVLQVRQPGAELFIEPISSASLLDEVLREVIGGEPRASVDIEVSCNLSATLLVDSNKVKRVFSNIIVNACQAMEWSGRLWIRSKIQSDKVHFVVGNGGSLIPPDSQHQVFDAFYTNNKRSGTGLGLAIAKKWVEAHGGQIECHSAMSDVWPHGYVEFSFSLPVTESSQGMSSGESRQFNSSIYRLGSTPNELCLAKEPVVPISVPDPEPIVDSPTPLKVAHIDDSLIMRMTWQRALQGKAVFSSFSKPEELFDQTEPFDLVITDLYFENSSYSGRDALSWLRRHFPLTKVAASSNAQPDELFGFDAILSKDESPNMDRLRELCAGLS
jgi:signal transduction histidine kinase